MIYNKRIFIILEIWWNVLFKTPPLLAVTLNSKGMECTVHSCERWVVCQVTHHQNAPLSEAAYLSWARRIYCLSAQARGNVRKAMFFRTSLSCLSSGWQGLEHLNKSVWVGCGWAKSWRNSPLLGSRGGAIFLCTSVLGKCGAFFVILLQTWACRRWEQQAGRLGAGRKTAWHSGWWAVSTSILQQHIMHADMGLLEISLQPPPATEVWFTWSLAIIIHNYSETPSAQAIHTLKPFRVHRAVHTRSFSPPLSTPGRRLALPDPLCGSLWVTSSVLFLRSVRTATKSVSLPFFLRSQCDLWGVIWTLVSPQRHRVDKDTEV